METKSKYFIVTKKYLNYRPQKCDRLWYLGCFDGNKKQVFYCDQEIP